MILEIAIAASSLVIGRWFGRWIPRRAHAPRAAYLVDSQPQPTAWQGFVAAVRCGDVTFRGECSRCGSHGSASTPPVCGGGSVCRARPVAMPIPGPGMAVRR